MNRPLLRPYVVVFAVSVALLGIPQLSAEDESEGRHVMLISIDGIATAYYADMTP